MKRITKKLGVLSMSLMLCMVVIRLQAQTPAWTQLSPTGSVPTTRWVHTAIYDSANNRMTIFGGSVGSNLNDVWVLSNANGLGGIPAWSQLSPIGSAPTGRYSHTAVYDAANYIMTIFGGYDGAYLNDVWVLNNANNLGGTPAWTQLSPTGSAPAGRYAHTAIYDATNNIMTIFGGTVLGGSYLNDVWVLSNANGLGGTPAWTQLSPTGSAPTTRFASTAVYDTTNNRMTIFGGICDSGFLNDVWVLSNTNGLGGTPAWTQLNPTPDPVYGLPTTRYLNTALYNATDNQMTIFGGSDGGNYLNDIWVLSNANGLGGMPAWTQIFPTGSNSTIARVGHTAVYDTTNNRMIIFAGYDGTLLNDVWVLSTSVPAPTPPIAGFYAIPTSGFGNFAVNFTDISASNPTTWNWDFGDGATSNIQNPFHVYSTVSVSTSYTVSLIVSNSLGTSTSVRVGYILATPFAPHPKILGDLLGTNESFLPPMSWATHSQMVIPRYVSAAGVINGIFYIAGGWNGYHESSTLQAYDPVADTWTLLADMPQGRYEGSGAGVINGKLYVVGGWDNSYSYLPHNNLFIYDPTTNTWSSGAPMLRLSGLGATGVINGELYVMTPADGYSGYYQFFDKYDPISNTWTNLPDIPHVHVNSGYGVISGKFYVVGGYDVNGNDITGTLDMYDPTVGSWKTLSPMPTARQSVTSAVLNGQLYVFGGNDTSNNILNTVEAYDPNSDTWSTQTSIPTARAGASAGTINSQIYVIGGTNPSNIAYIDVNQNNIVDQGDTLSVQFDRQVQVNGATPSDFFLLVNGDSFGAGATVSINSANNTQVIITLGSSPVLTIPGILNGITTSGSPSGMDVLASITPGHITDLETGVDAVNNGQPGVNGFAFDMVYAVSDNTTSFSAATGGTVQVVNNNTNNLYTKHKLDIPAGSLTSNVSITAGKPGDPHGTISAVLFSSSSTITFSQSTPATLVLEFKDTDIQLEAGNLPTSMRIFQYNTTAQKYLLVPQTYSPQSVDTVNKQVTVSVTSFDVFGQGIVQPFATSVLPTVDGKDYSVGPAPQSILHPFTNNLVLTVGTSGIYTLDQLVIPDYQLTVSGTTISLEQATLEDKNGWLTNALLKIVTNSNPTTQPILTMEYKNHNDANGQFTNDVIGGTESQIRIYRWLADTEVWQEIPGVQTVNKANHTVTVTIPDTLTTAQIYAVAVDTTAPSITTDVTLPWELFDRDEYSLGTQNIDYNLDEISEFNEKQ